MGRKSGILLIVAGGLLLSPFLAVPLYIYAHHYYTVGLTIDPRGYVVLSAWIVTGILLLALGMKALRNCKPK